MRRQIEINISEDFAVLCSFWNKSPKQVVDYYLKNISMNRMLYNLLDAPANENDFFQKFTPAMMKNFLEDPVSLATFFSISFTESSRGKLNKMIF